MASHRYTYPSVSEVSTRVSRRDVEWLLTRRADRMAVSAVRKAQPEAPAAAPTPEPETRDCRGE